MEHVLQKIAILNADITTLKADAIVNAANSSLLGGGGVDGCIHAAAGPGLLEECRKLNGCKVGEAKITSGHHLPAKYIIHTVGPKGIDPVMLQKCYESCLQLVLENNIRTIVFCSISTGVYGYPIRKAAPVAFSTIKEWLLQHHDKVEKISICTFGKHDQEVYNKIYQENLIADQTSRNNSSNRAGYTKIVQAPVKKVFEAMEISDDDLDDFVKNGSIDDRTGSNAERKVGVKQPAQSNWLTSKESNRKKSRTDHKQDEQNSSATTMGTYSKVKLREWLSDDSNDHKYTAWTTIGSQELDSMIREYEIETVSKFSIQVVDKNFGNIDLYSKKHKVRWEDEGMKFNGVPFAIVGVKKLDCQHGFDRKFKAKERSKQNKNKLKMTDHNFMKTNILLQDTKKFGCNAQIKIKEIHIFPDFKIDNDTAWKRSVASKQLRNAITDKSVNLIRQFVIVLPHPSQHTEHKTGDAAGICQPIDKRLIEEIHRGAGIVRSVSEMRRCLDTYVKRELFKDGEPPSKSNKRFYPRQKTIRSHMLEALKKFRYSKIDQECLCKKIEDWKKSNPKDNIFFQPKGNQILESNNGKDNNEDSDDEDIKLISTPGDSLLFVYQSEWQKRLLGLYGNELCLLDATYKTTRYSLPLFFLVVKTNVGYSVVATFISEGESTENIKAGLQVIKDWNPNFSPMFAMVDCCSEEINAIESLYPDCQVVLCDFHREQAWERWLNKRSNGAFNIKELMLCKFRRIARAPDEHELTMAISALKSCAEWKDPTYSKMVKWFQKQWMPLLKRWVWCYRRERLMVNVNTNNGVERQNEVFKYQYLRKHHGSSITGMLTILIEEYFPDCFESYCDINTRSSNNYRRYNSNIPSFLHNRPRNLVRHCLEKIDLAKTIDSTGVLQKEFGKFVVISRQRVPSERYEVYFGNDEDYPKCTCFDWNKTGFPCKHFFAVFNKFPAWNWNAMSPLYINSPFMVLDELVNPILERNISNEEGKFDLMNESFEIEVPQELSTLPPRKTCKTSKAALCRELLKNLINDTYLLEDFETLENIYGDLLQIKESINERVPKENNIKLLPETVKNKKVNKKPAMKHAFSTYNLPLRKKCNKYSGRVGEKATTMKGAQSLKLEEEQLDNVVIDTTPSALGIKDDDIDVISISDDDDNRTLEKPNRKISLPAPEVDLIQNGEMLTDITINAAQEILKKQFFGVVHGLQDPVLGQKLMYRKMTGEFVQILHNGNLHWVAVSTYGCARNEINYYDSLYHGRIKDHIKMQICSIMQIDSTEIAINVKPCQQQKNGVDCGIFSIINVFLTLAGKDIKCYHFNEGTLRTHLLNCIDDGFFTEFPLLSGKSLCNSPKQVNVELFCRCKLPWLWYHNKQKDFHMAQCEKCDDWFHRKCEKIPDNVFNSKDKLWNCSSCSQV